MSVCCVFVLSGSEGFFGENDPNVSKNPQPWAKQTGQNFVDDNRHMDFAVTHAWPDNCESHTSNGSSSGNRATAAAGEPQLSRGWLGGFTSFRVFVHGYHAMVWHAIESSSLVPQGTMAVAPMRL